MTNKDVNRRSFIQTTSIGASVIAAGSARNVLGANDEVVLGIIGTGGRGQSLLKRITNIPNVRIACICDLRENRREQAAVICEDYNPKPNLYSEFRDMLDKEKLDGCIVATEVGNHAHCVVPVLETGLNCFSEKPMDCTVEKVDRIVKAARKAKGFYQVGFQRRYNPGFMKSIEHIHNGEMGKITFLQGQWQWTWSVGGWVLDVDMSGGELAEQACHHMDVMNWVMNNTPPVRCAAMGAITVPHTEPYEQKMEHLSEDHSAVMFEFPGGVTFSYTHLFYCCEQFCGEKLWVYTEKGGVDLPQAMKYPRAGMGDPERLGPESPDWDHGTYEELAAFVDQIRNNKKPLSDQETGRISTLMSLMGRKAMYKRKTKSFEPTVVTWEELGSTT